MINPPEGKKKTITVEDLLVWAYRDELVHAARREGMPNELAGAFKRPRLAMSQMHETVNASVKMDFEAPRDAYVVHAAVLALGTVDAALPSLVERRVCGVADTTRARIYAAIEGEERDDGSTVIARGQGAVEAGYWAVAEEAVRVDCAQLVFEHAARASRPEWFPVPLLRMRHRESHTLESACVIHPRSRRPWYCVVSPEGDLPHEVERCRALYVLWRESLRRVRDHLHALDRFDVLDHLPLAAPWLEKSP